MHYNVEGPSYNIKFPGNSGWPLWLLSANKSSSEESSCEVWFLDTFAVVSVVLEYLWRVLPRDWLHFVDGCYGDPVHVLQRVCAPPAFIILFLKWPNIFTTNYTVATI